MSPHPRGQAESALELPHIVSQGQLSSTSEAHLYPEPLLEKQTKTTKGNQRSLTVEKQVRCRVDLGTGGGLCDLEGEADAQQPRQGSRDKQERDMEGAVAPSPYVLKVRPGLPFHSMCRCSACFIK